MNKSTKIWVNYIAGAIISIFLLWNIYGQVTKQLATLDKNTWTQTGHIGILIAAIVLMFANTSLEAYRWYVLTRSVEPITYRKAFASYLAGLALSIITPNRVGEYPARILYLGQRHTFRFINVSLMAILAQLSAVYFFGFLGLVFYCLAFGGLNEWIGLGIGAILALLIAIAYWRFDRWLPWFARFSWLRRFVIYGRLINRFTPHGQVLILGLSYLRFIVYSIQFILLLAWLQVDIAPADAFFMISLFFWVMAVIPSIALTEIGIRGTVSIYLFSHYSNNTLGIVAASTGIWMLNLIIPSIIGSILILRMRLLRQDS